MEIVNFLANMWGFLFVVLGLIFLIQPKNIAHIFSLVEQPITLFLAGLINLVLGIVLVLTYNVWDSSWKVIITMLGWLVLLRGVLILLSPETVKKIVEKVKTKTDWISIGLVIFVIIGCVLIYLSQTI